MINKITYGTALYNHNKKGNNMKVTNWRKWTRAKKKVFFALMSLSGIYGILMVINENTLDGTRALLCSYLGLIVFSSIHPQDW